MNDKPVIVHGDGTSTWVSTHSEDLARGVVPLIGNDDSLGQIFHITSDEVTTWNMIYQEIAGQLAKKLNLLHVTTDKLQQSKKYDLLMSIKGDKQHSVIFDNDKIKRIKAGSP